MNGLENRSKVRTLAQHGNFYQLVKFGHLPARWAGLGPITIWTAVWGGILERWNISWLK
jgi:hypothetical protein